MSQNIRETHALSAGDVSAKKRGRPHEDLVQVERKAASESSKKGNKSAAADGRANGNGAVGQVVTGVIDGSFDAGYLLTVRVGDSDSLLRGVVFLPGRFAPVNAQNDVAPMLVTYHRKRFNIPKFNLKPYGPLEPKDQAPTSGNSCPSNPQSVVSEVLMRQSSTVMPKNDAGHSPSGKAISLQVKEPGLDSQSTAILMQLESAKVAEQGKVSREIEASKLMKGSVKVEPNEKSKLMEGAKEVEANEKSKAEPATEPPVVHKLQVIEAVANEPETEHQALLSSELSNDLVHDLMETLDAKLRQPPLVSEPAFMDFESNSEPVNTLLEKLGDGETGHAVEVPNGEGKPAVDTASNITGMVCFSAVKDIEPETVSKGEAFPCEPEPASERNVPPGENKPQIPIPSGDITDMECND